MSGLSEVPACMAVLTGRFGPELSARDANQRIRAHGEARKDASRSYFLNSTRSIVPIPSGAPEVVSLGTVVDTGYDRTGKVNRRT